MKKNLLSISIILLANFPSFSIAGIQIDNNKFIYIENANNRKIEIKNTSDQEYIIKSSVKQINNDNKEESPFIISPPLFKLNANETFFLDVIKIDDIEVKDKESLYKINIKSIPIINNEIKDNNILHVSLNLIYNLIYRPDTLDKKHHEMYKDIVFIKDKKGKLRIANPTPYYITLTQVESNNTAFINKKKALSPFSHYDTGIEVNNNDLINYSVKNEHDVIINYPSKEIVHEK